MKVTVAAIAPCYEDLTPLIKRLEEQSREPDQFVWSTADSIPRAWNECIDQATGDLILFTESDVRPPRHWVEDMAAMFEEQDDRRFAMGHEVRLPDDVHCMSNVAVRTRVAKRHPFREEFDITEDTKWFQDLMESGIRVSKDQKCPVVMHLKDRPTPGRSLVHGINRAEIWLDGDYDGKTPTGVTGKRINRILCELATLAGQAIGVLRHPVKLWRRIR